MSYDLNFSSRSDNRFESLTMLYLQGQDLSELTPEQFLDKYKETYDRIRNHYANMRNDVKRTE